MKIFLGTYLYKGRHWAFEIEAEDRADAEARLKWLTTGRINGELLRRIPVDVDRNVVH